MTNAVNIGGPAGELLDSGLGVFLAVVIYDVEEDALHFGFPANIEAEEAVAILEKFGCFPKAVEE